MADESTPTGDIRDRSFPTERRGYGRAEVDRFKREVAERVDALEARLAEYEARFSQLGIDRLEDLKAEFDAVGAEVAKILQEARRAAEQLRSRAAADAARWRAEADEEARATRTEAQQQTTEMRSQAWEQATSMLEGAKAERELILEAAKEAALHIRAAAEREAVRLTGDARRDAEEDVRAAKVEAERLLMAARAESQSILGSARQSAESAQERAKALEQRRAELMEELESARNSIGQLEQEIDTRREALQIAHGGATVVEGPPEGRGQWGEDDLSVKIVPASRIIPSEPVDADAMAEEVERLRSPGAVEDAVPPEAPALAEPADDHIAGDADAPAAEKHEAGEGPELDSGEASPESAAGAEAAASEPSALSDVGATAADGATAAGAEPTAAEPTEAERVPASESAPADEVPAEPASDDAVPAAPAPNQSAAGGAVAADISGTPAEPDPIESLFAKLRLVPEPEPQVAASEDAPAAGGVVASAASADEHVDNSEPATPSPSVATAEAGDETAQEAAAAPAPAALEADPFELRDRLLLPVTNRALRGVKREIVDLQNRVLEEVRLNAGGWNPDTAMFVAAFGDDIAQLIREGYVAGYAGAAEMVGAPTPQPDRPSPTDATPGFVAALADAVEHALRQAEGGGSRQVSAAVSKVFRAWRTDEAERRLRAAATLAYHEGVVTALPSLGVHRVMAVCQGSVCRDGCPAAGAEAWDPAGELPSGTRMPPAGPRCTSTIVPAGE